MSWLSIFLAVIPVFIILLLVYSKDKNKEPLSLLIILFLSGLLSCGLVLIITDIFGIFLPFIKSDNKNIIEILIYSFIVVALVEEFCKFIMVMLIGYNHKEYDEDYDILIYSIFVSLGFAFIENLLCIANNESIKLAIMRGISAVPSHACDAVFMGYFLSLAKKAHINKDFSSEKKNIILSLILPTILHGVYDFLIMSKVDFAKYFFIVFVILLYIVSFRRLKSVSGKNERLNKQLSFCKKCGRPLTGNICSNCGQVHNL